MEPPKALSGPPVSSGFLIQSAGLYLLCHTTSREGVKEEEPADSSSYLKDGKKAHLTHFISLLSLLKAINTVSTFPYLLAFPFLGQWTISKVYIG